MNLLFILKSLIWIETSDHTFLKKMYVKQHQEGDQFRGSIVWDVPPDTSMLQRHVKQEKTECKFPFITILISEVKQNK